MLSKSTSLLCRFAFFFCLAAKTFTIDCDACSSGRSAGTSVLLLFESVTLFDSDPGLSVVFTQRPDSDFNSMFPVDNWS